MIQLQGATVDFATGNRVALDGIHLHIGVGERVALWGANGSGKTTLLRVLHGLQPLAGGSLHCSPVVQAMVFQRPYLLRASVRNNVALAVWLRGGGWRHARARALECLALVGLQDCADQAARNLSIGQQQRVAWARAWAVQPQLLLLDEPCANLDRAARQDLERLLLQGLAAGPGAGSALSTLVFSSHDLAQVQRLARRVVVLERGRVLADVSVEEFMSAGWPQRVLVGADPIVQGDA